PDLTVVTRRNLSAHVPKLRLNTRILLRAVWSLDILSCNNFQFSIKDDLSILQHPTATTAAVLPALRNFQFCRSTGSTFLWQPAPGPAGCRVPGCHDQRVFAGSIPAGQTNSSRSTA